MRGKKASVLGGDVLGPLGLMVETKMLKVGHVKERRTVCLVADMRHVGPGMVPMEQAR